MDNIKQFFKNSANAILHIIVTVALCFICSNVFGANSVYSLFASIAVSCLIVFLIGRMVFGKKGSGSAANSLLQIVCALTIIISINHLYNERVLTGDSPWIHGISQGLLFLLLIGVFIVLALLFLLMKYVRVATTPQQHLPHPQPQPHQNQSTQQSSNAVAPATPLKKSLFPAFRVLGIIVLIVAIVIASLWAYSKLNIPNPAEGGKTADLSALVSYLLGYGASILFIIFALAIIVLALIELARFLYSRIALFKEERKKGKSETSTLTYVFSVLIVFAMILLTYKISDFTFDKFTEIAWGGDYLALPLILLVGIVAIVLLIRLTHGILSLVMKPDPFDVEETLKELEVGSHIKNISISIVKIFFGTIRAALDFVVFIPNFFEAMGKLVLSDDDGDDDWNDE